MTPQKCLQEWQRKEADLKQVAAATDQKHLAEGRLCVMSHRPMGVGRWVFNGAVLKVDSGRRDAGRPARGRGGMQRVGAFGRAPATCAGVRLSGAVCRSGYVVSPSVQAWVPREGGESARELGGAGDGTWSKEPRGGGRLNR